MSLTLAPKLQLDQSLKLSVRMQQAMKLLAMSEDQLAQRVGSLAEDNPALEAHRSVAWEGLPTDGLSSSTTLLEHIKQQMRLNRFNVVEQEIGDRLLWDMNDRGYIEADVLVLPEVKDEMPKRKTVHSRLASLKQKLGFKKTQTPQDAYLERVASSLSYPVSWVESVRRRIRAFEPEGCLSFGLREHLGDQAKSLPHALAQSVTLALDDVLNNDWRALKNSLNEMQLAEVIQWFHRHRCGPNVQFQASTWDKGGLWVDLEVRIEGEHFEIVKKDPIGCRVLTHGSHQAAQRWLSSFAREGRSLIHVLRRREETIASIVRATVEAQRVWFFEDGPLCALTQCEIAQITGFHESTVSRAIHGKWIQCPRGRFPLSYFFSLARCGSNGQVHAVQQILEEIKTLIAHEDHSSPLSDSEIEQQLRAKEILIDRRSISRYRETLHIPPTSVRRRLPTASLLN